MHPEPGPTDDGTLVPSAPRPGRRRVGSRRLVALAAAGLVALPVAACAGGDAAEPAAPTTGAEGAGVSSTPQTAQQPVTAAESEAAPQGAVLDRRTVKGRGDYADIDVDLAIRSLQVRGKLATLRVAFTGKTSSSGSPEDEEPSIYDLNGGNSLLVSLLDPVNLKRYEVVTAGPGKKLESDVVFSDATFGQPIEAYYTFAAPPAGVESIDVQVGDWPRFDGVRISR